jgi:hypothetical protein
MPLPSVGGGFQIGDGNLNEIFLGEMADPQTATSTATLTAAQVTGGVLVANPSTTAASYTLPTVALTEAVLTNAKVGSTFELALVNLGTSSGAVTVLVGTGWTIVGNAVVAVTSSARFLARKSDVSAWVLYRVA